MENAMMLLKAIGELPDSVIRQAHAGKAKPKLSRKTLILIAAAALLLLLAGCAAAWHWYTVYFTGKRQEPLSQDQIGYIQENTEQFGISQTCGGYTLELKSALSTGGSAFVTFQLTAPEDVKLSDVLDLRREERLSFERLLAYPAGSSLPADLSYETAEDGDGRDNTVNFVLRITPVLSAGEESPFGPGKSCRIEFRNLIHWGYDREYEQQLRQTRYDGQQNVMFTPEESERIHPSQVLAEGQWQFELELEQSDLQELSLLTAPIETQMYVLRTGETEWDLIEGAQTVTVTEIRLTALELTITFLPPEGSFDSLFADVSDWQQDGTADPIVLVLKDGTKITFFQSTGAKQTAVLEADSPINLNSADYLLLSDGTRIDIDDSAG